MMNNRELWKLPANVASHPQLTGNEKILYSYLISNPAAAAEPNTQSMAEACGVDKTTTLLAVKGLERARLLKVSRTNAKKLRRMLDIQVLDCKPARTTRRKKR